MKLKLRIGRQQAHVPESQPQPQPQPARTFPAARTPLPRTPDQRVVRAGSFCRATEVGQSAVTEAGRAVLAIRAGRCGRWIYA